MELQKNLHVSAANINNFNNDFNYISCHAAAHNQQNSVRAGMRNSEPTMLSFLQVPNASGLISAGKRSSARSSVLRQNQGECCWRLHNSRSLKYRLCSDLLCSVTILPGSLAVIILTVTYLAGEPTPHEPYPWLKYAMAGMGCLLLGLCLVWMATAACVYRKALARRRVGEMEEQVGDADDSEAEEDALEIAAGIPVHPATPPNPTPGITITPAT